ncbi:centrosomal protein 43 isoform X3 [Coregonus clupeaformis]|uniref:centrosomal protein 43 isoform X3 n=1 Tax=Coregonus clupeaformis TaxID=59861 RepID=UPI001BDF7AF6|nr:centrosomal protein 43 isoform X3 [Coregonus clupeaformis]
MSATDDDTELRDLLIQNLENSGVLNKLKAEMRAAVFLAMDEQDKVENKTPLVNENLKKCLNTKDGRLVASLIIDFLQVFHLDFTLAVFQPEINSLNGLDSREQVSCELGITETDMNRNTPLLLELVKRGRHREKNSIFSEGHKATNIPKELTPRQIADARKKFDSYDKASTGGIRKEDLKVVFGDVFPNFNKNMLEKFVTDEHRAGDKASSKSIDFQEFLGLYKRFFSQCRSVVTHDTSDIIYNPSRFIEEKINTSPASKIPRFKGHKHSAQAEKANAKGVEVSHSHSDTSLRFGSLQGKGQGHVTSMHSEASGDNDNGPTVSLKKGLDLEVEEDADEDDSFFDDPLPKQQKIYGCSSLPPAKSHSGASLSEKRNSQKDFVRSLREESLSGRSFNPMRRGTSLNDLSALGSDTEGDGDELFSDYGNKLSCLEHRRAADSDPAPQRSAAGGGFHSGEAHHRDLSGSRNGTSNKDKGFKDLKMMNDKTGSSAQDDDYDDDFNSHRSDISKSEVSIGEEIEEVSIEGPDNSDKFDEITQDLSVSQLSQSQGADYMEEVA